MLNMSHKYIFFFFIFLFLLLKSNEQENMLKENIAVHIIHTICVIRNMLLNKKYEINMLLSSTQDKSLPLHSLSSIHLSLSNILDRYSCEQSFVPFMNHLNLFLLQFSTKFE